MDDKLPLLTLGLRIREMRKLKGISQEQFALLADIDRSYLGAIERGKRNITFLTLVKIAECLECSVSDLTQGILE